MDKVSELVVFARVAELASFTAAAERLGVDRSVASKAVTRLEDRLGARLFHRTTRKLSLTTAGEELLRRIAGPLGEIDAAERELAARTSEPRGKLRVALPMGFGLMHIAPAIPDFLAQNPRLSLEVALDDRHTDLVASGLDLAIRIAELESSSLVATRIATIDHVAVASPAYLARHGTPRELLAHRCLVYSSQPGKAVWTFEGADGVVEIAPPAALTANNSLLLREAALAGAGIALTPRFYVAGDLGEGRLTEILRDYGKRRLGLHAVYPARRHIARPARAFVAFLAARFGTPPYWDPRGTR
jgi:DNA-binding transcriptional LysR family regulator